MNRTVYDDVARVQDTHWWFVGRRSVIRSLLTSLRLPTTPRILEISASAGANLQLLSDFGTVVACEADDAARATCTMRGWNAIAGYLPNGFSGIDDRFDLICLFDVLEHVADDMASIAALRRLLAPKGKLIITCPAYAWLYGKYDKALGHYRRYTATELRRLVVSNGLSVERAGYFNAFLFPATLLGRLADSTGLPARRSGLKLPPGPLNCLLEKTFSSEAIVTRHALFPFGTTAVVCASLGEGGNRA